MSIIIIIISIETRNIYKIYLGNLNKNRRYMHRCVAIIKIDPRETVCKDVNSFNWFRSVIRTEI
jgi:hypothetical protein